ncbi:hypothetical protein [Alkalinema sp. FACHB-956]|uniref:hypothetical protein n=1 Tax=Alkalinema sp. FACHB-956 TaxID=2692768 RepID=UPI001681F623|nr:hypothetical protein [Alkalinema sp. FACHB-956]MBD2327104.1 hypothetical protein [Alkalinema sp. FACHB-956]
MEVEVALTKQAVMVERFATVLDAIALMKEFGVRALLVEPCHANDPYCIVTEADIVYKVTAFARDPNTVRVYEIMSPLA